MRSERPITILARPGEPGRCRRCRRPILWVLTAPHGRAVPLDAPPLVLEQVQHPTSGVQFHVIPAGARHRCPPRGGA